MGSQELGSAYTNICMGLKLYGECNAKDKVKCGKHLGHTFTKEILEAKSAVSKFKNGRVDLRIIECKKPNYYQAEVHNFYEVMKGMKINNKSFINIGKKRHEGLDKFYSNVDNRNTLNYLSVGVLCALELAEDEDDGRSFTRGRIVEEIKLDNDAPAVHYRVWCVDMGEYKIRRPDQLFILPQEYVHMSPLVVNVIIAEIRPLDDQDQFPENTSGWNDFAGQFLKDRIVSGIVSLSIEDTIWVKSLFECIKVEDGTWVQKLNLRNEILRKLCIAKDNPSHLPILYELCEDKGFDCKMYKPSTTVLGPEYHGQADSFQWAFLNTRDSNNRNPETTKLWSTYIDSPNKIYGIQDQFEAILNDLVEELNVEICSLIEEKHRDYESKFFIHYKKGLCIAAKDLEGRWARALIVRSNKNEDHGNLVFDIFFVDHGDSIENLTPKDMFPIPGKFVQRLPFQAIRLRLKHVEPKNGSGDWTTAATEHLEQQLVKNGASERLDVMPVKRNQKHSILDPFEYDSYIFNPTSELGQSLVDANFATFKAELLDDYSATKAKLLENVNSVVEAELLNITGAAKYDDEDEGMQGALYVGLEELQLAEAPDLAGFDVFIDEEAAQNVINHFFDRSR